MAAKKVSSTRSVGFRAKVDAAHKILVELKLIDRRNYWPDYSHIARQVRHGPYRDEYAYYEQNGLFDFLLYNGGIMQFKENPEAHTTASFCFYEQPLAVDDFGTFVKDRYDIAVADLGDLEPIARGDYEDYVSTANLKKAVTTLRYDHSPGLYTEGSHPCSHLHVGHGTEIRVGTHRVLNPMSFTLLVLRQVYTWRWETFIHESGAGQHMRHVRAALAKVDTEYLKTKDAWEMYLE